MKPLVIKDVDKCVVIPSPNKWNCHTFPARSKVTVSAHAGNSDAVCRHDQAGTMNSARPMTPQTLEINGLYNSQQNSKIASSSLSDYKVQVEETTGNGLNRTDSGYKRSAFNEKLTKLKLHRIGVNKTDTPLSPTNDVSPVEAQTKKWPTLSKSASFRAYSGTRQHRPSTRSSSADPATEEKTIFGFRVLKGTLPSTSVMTGKQNDQRSSSFVRGGSLRLPRRGYYDGGSNSSGRSGRPLFYAPKESSLSKSKEVSEVCSMAEDARTVNSRDSADKKEKSNEKMESKEEGEQKAGKLVIRAESLQEGKSRLQEFREKQRIGKLTRSFTSPEHEASDTLSKSKNIRESLADIRERIRERRRKKEEGKRLQTTPGNESTSSKESVEKENIVDSSAEQQSELLSSDGATYEEKKEDKDLVLKKKEEEIEELPTSSVRQEDLNANEIELQEDINANKLQPSVNSDDKSGCTLRKLENNEKTSSCDQTKPSESKKPTKRERRKLERYQRSKTMSAIMYNDISLSAAREIAHEENDPHSNKGKQLITMPSVSEVKKRFLESEGTNVNSKTNELGLFYSLKVPTSSKVGSKKEKNKNADGNADTERDKPPIQDKSNFPEANFDNKPKLSRRYTLGMSTDLSKDAILKNRRTVLNNNSQNNGSVVRNPDDGKEETFLSGGFLTKRRHTFSEDSSWSKLNRNNLKASESVEKLREKFSQGEALFPKRWHSASKHVSRQTFSSEDMKPDNETSQSKQPRRRVTSEGGAAKIKTEVETSKNCSNGSSLCRRHTIGNRPTKIEKLNSEKLNEQKESRKIHDNSLLKDDVAYGKKPASVEKKNFSANEGSCSSATKKEDPVKSIVLKEKEERQVVKKKKEEGKTSVSKLRNLFLGKPSSREKKPKLRDRRAKTIAEGISPEITKELVINSHNNTPWSDLNGSVVKPDHYVTESATEKPTEEWNSETIRCPGEGERAGDSREEGTCPKIDLRPGRYLSSGPEGSLSNFVPSSPEETEVDSVFHDEEKAEKKPNVPDINDADVLNKSLESDPSLNTSSSNDGTKCKENISKAEVSHENSVLLKDQYLDDYLTTIETLAGSPKNQRKFLNSTRGLTQKPKLNGTQTLSRDINVAEGDSRNFAQNKHLNLPHTNLMHSWSTSDLDKLFYSGESNNFPHVASEREISTEDLDEISDRTTR